ncbi:MAG: vgrG2 [Gammaproteobacteria bacterium]|jgi:type VI secretion system secreted protein VgrG|nr:vgrG2 [Gammaproteobacteria bacterium]
MLSQANRLIAVETPLGEDALILTAFSGREAISQLFQFELDMFSSNTQLNAKELVGKSISFLVRGKNEQPYYFNGLVVQLNAGAIDMHGLRAYRATVVPWLWLLTRTSNCRIFQNKSVPEIIEAIFKDYDLQDYETIGIKNNYAKREYCVQYQESDFNFISRLLEQEGIFYYFRHQQGKHILVLADQNTTFKDGVVNELYYAPDSYPEPHVMTWQHNYEFCIGRYAQADYNFETPAANLLATTDTLVSLPNNSKYERYVYPGNYKTSTEGEAYTKIRIEQEEVGFNQIHATSNAMGLACGTKFKLHWQDCPQEQANYVITSIEHSATDASHLAGQTLNRAYHNQFRCIPAEVTFRPSMSTPVPHIVGAQTALVVGAEDEEIYTDKYGRLKVQFYWDREGKKNEQSSCWVRVAQQWAGNHWGQLFLPRVGQEVVVNFLEGNPDRPVIVGSVYNAGQMPPYDLPTNRWQSGIKTQSEQGSTSTFNELRFDDKKDKEEIYLHAQRDYRSEIEQDQKETIKNDHTLAVEHDQKITITNDHTLAVDNDQTIIVKNKREVTVDQGDQILSVKQGNRKVSVQAGNDTHEIQMGNRKVDINMGDDQLTIGTGNQTTQLNLGKSTTQAMQAIELKVGANSIKIDQTGVTISGLMVKIEGQTLVQVSANAMLTLKGGITMIN